MLMSENSSLTLCFKGAGIMSFVSTKLGFANINLKYVWLDFF